MGSLSSRLDRLEAKAPGPQPQGDALIRLRVLITANDRYRAVQRGEEPPPYPPAEQAAMHEDDLEIVAGGGVVGWLRDSGGWDSPESQEFLAELEEGARKRVSAM